MKDCFIARDRALRLHVHQGLSLRILMPPNVGRRRMVPVKALTITHYRAPRNNGEQQENK